MWLNFLKIAFRNLVRSRTYTFLNVIGLCLGLMSCLYLIIYVQDEWSYDRHLANAERMYRITTDVINPDQTRSSAASPFQLAPLVKAKHPGIDEITRFFYNGEILIEQGDREIKGEHAFYADSSFFDVFQVSVLAGSLEGVLDNPGDMVLSEKMARAMFGSPQQALGKRVKLEKKYPAIVKAVVKDLPPNTHLHFDVVLQVETIKDFWFVNGKESYLNTSFYTYALLKPGSTPEDLQTNLDRIYDDHLKPAFDKANFSSKYHVQPITDIHLYSHRDGEIEANNHTSWIYIFSLIGLFIMLIAAVNYINLSTARSVSRAREVGVRKVLGSHRIHLIGQFLTEAFILVFISGLMALVLVELGRPTFEHYTEKTFPSIWVHLGWLLPAGLLLIVVLTLVSGLYPAFVLSGFSPAKTLKGNFTHSRGGTRLRKGLVVFQFSISLILIISTLIVYRQLSFIQNKDMGYNQEQVFLLYYFNETDRWDAFREVLLENPNVKAVARSSASPGVGDTYSSKYTFQTEEGFRTVNTNRLATTEHFLDLMQIKILAGRGFSNPNQDEEKSIIINEQMLQWLGYELNSEDPNKDPLGKQVRFNYGQDDKPGANAKIVGVVSDFHLSNLRKPIEPLAIHYDQGEAWRTYVKIAPQDINKTISFIKDTWYSFIDDEPFAARPMDQLYFSQYKQEQRQGRLFLLFSVLAILIACLGMSGLATYTVQTRTKEIGIRKVLGANAAQVVKLVSRDFITLVFMAGLLAFPLTYWFLSIWLEGFVYRIELPSQWIWFLLSWALAIVISFLTISRHAWKATTINPVEVLKDE